MKDTLQIDNLIQIRKKAWDIFNGPNLVHNEDIGWMYNTLLDLISRLEDIADVATSIRSPFVISNRRSQYHDIEKYYKDENI